MTLADAANGPTWPAYIVVVLFAILSTVLLSGRGSWLIAGYNTASKKEKEKYDQKKLCRVTGAGVAVITALLLVMVVFEHQIPLEFAYVVPVIICLVTAAIVVLGNTVCKKK